MGRTHGSAATKNKQNIWLLYAEVRDRQTLADALCALYYLPDRFKLVTANTDVSTEVSRKHRDIMDRVDMAGNKTESQQAAPFIFIHNSVDEARATRQKPSIVLADNPEQEIKDYEWGGFVVPRSEPEALASAVLNITRSIAFSEGQT